MKKLLLLSSMFILALGTYAQVGVWASKSSGFQATSSGIKYFSVVDANVIWATSYDGSGVGLPRQDYTISTDGGNTWTVGSVPVPATWDWAALTAVSATEAWAVFYEAQITQTGQIWHTTNGGTTWTQQGAGQVFTNATESFPNNIYFWNSNEGVVMGDQVNGRYEIYTTMNGGTTWDSVLAANIAPPNDVDENAWTTHFTTVGDTIWFDTNEGRVYRSVDRGHTWTAATSTLPVVLGDAIDICFTSGSNGIARFYEDATITNTVVTTTDGGNNWTQVFPSGDFFGGDVRRVPGVAGMMVSTGISSVSGFTGSSYTTDGGLTWTTIESGTQRGSLGVADSLTMWCGGFTTSPTAGGIYKFEIPAIVPCNDPTISAGTASADDTILCGTETVTITSTGVVSPVIGNWSGVSWVITSADISNSTDPLIEPSLITSYTFTYPAPSTSVRTFTNDAAFIGSVFPYGVYYWTPIVYGNATETNPPAQFLQDLTLDVSCTTTGTSVAVHVYDPADPICGVGINEINKNQLAVYASLKDRNTIDVLINSNSYGKIIVQILDLTGRIVTTKNSYVTKGSNHEFINVDGLANGTYVVKAEVNGIFAVNKLIKN